MKKTLAIMALGLGIGSFSFAADTCRDTELYANMEDMRSAMRNLSFELRASNFESAAEHAQALLVSSELSAEHPPFRTQQLNEDEQQAFVENYQQSMDRLLELIADLQASIAEEDGRAAGQVMAAIDNHSRSSHRQFKARGCN